MNHDHGSLIDVQGRSFVVLGTVPTDPPETLVVDARSGHPLLCLRNGAVRLPTAACLTTASSGPASLRSAPTSEARMRVEIGMLDAAGVPNGSKAIWLWLDANWTDELREGLGDFDDAATIKRWRTARRRLREEQS